MYTSASKEYKALAKSTRVIDRNLEGQNVSQTLLLPDEYCLAEGRANFEISCDRAGSQRGSREDVYARMDCMVYITNDRVRTEYCSS